MPFVWLNLCAPSPGGEGWGEGTIEVSSSLRGAKTFGDGVNMLFLLSLGRGFFGANNCTLAVYPPPWMGRVGVG